MSDSIDSQAAMAIRDRFHAEGNRFGMMARHHREEAAFKLGDEAKQHFALADKWALAQHLSFSAAGTISGAAGIPEYGRAWNERLQPHELEDSK
jgi:hypothetical protein